MRQATSLAQTKLHLKKLSNHVKVNAFKVLGHQIRGEKKDVDFLYRHGS